MCAHGYTYGLIDMRIYVFVSACACSPFLSDILTRPQYFFISFTLLIVLLYCYVLWCCTFATGQPLTLIKMMNYELWTSISYMSSFYQLWMYHVMKRPWEMDKHALEIRCPCNITSLPFDIWLFKRTPKPMYCSAKSVISFVVAHLSCTFAAVHFYFTGKNMWSSSDGVLMERQPGPRGRPGTGIF